MQDIKITHNAYHDPGYVCDHCYQDTEDTLVHYFKISVKNKGDVMTLCDNCYQQKLDQLITRLIQLRQETTTQLDTPINTPETTPTNKITNQN